MKVKITLLTALLALGLASCGGGAEPSTSKPSFDDSSENPSTTSQTTSEEQPSDTSAEETTSEETTSEETTSEEEISQGGDTSTTSEQEVKPQDYDLFMMFEPPVMSGEAIPGKFVYWYGEGASEPTFSTSDAGMTYTFTKGNQWYSNQIFIATPNAEAGDQLKVELGFTSTVAGAITICQTVYEVQVGANHIEYDVTVGSNLRAVDLQLGKLDGNVVLDAGSFTLQELSIKPYNGTYHYANFCIMTSATEYELVYRIPVKHGKTLYYVMDASSSMPEGYVFKGWLGTDGNYATTSTVINADSYFFLDVAKESEIEKATVTYKVGEETIKVVEENKDTVIVAPTFDWTEIGYAHKAVGFYDDADMQQPHDFSKPLTSDATIYVKRELDVSTWMMWDKAPEATMAVEGEKFVATNLNCGGDGNELWHVQVNFPAVPAEAGYVYTISYKYKLTATGVVHTQLWKDEANFLDLGNLVADGAEHEISREYNGSDFAAASFDKLTIELGKAGNGTNIEVYDVKLTVRAAA